MSVNSCCMYAFFLFMSCSYIDELIIEQSHQLFIYRSYIIDISLWASIAQNVFVDRAFQFMDCSHCMHMYCMYNHTYTLYVFIHSYVQHWCKLQTFSHYWLIKWQRLMIMYVCTYVHQLLTITTTSNLLTFSLNVLLNTHTFCSLSILILSCNVLILIHIAHYQYLYCYLMV